MVAGLRRQGWSVPDAQADFVWLRLHDRTAAFGAACEQAGVLVRPYGDDGVRITVGQPAENDRLLAAAADLVALRPAAVACAGMTLVCDDVGCYGGGCEGTRRVLTAVVPKLVQPLGRTRLRPCASPD